MNKKNKGAFAFVGILVVAVLLAVGGKFIHDNNQRVILCLVATHKCNTYTEKQVKSQYDNPNPNCIVTPEGQSVCRPNFVLYRIESIAPTLRQKCQTEAHGHITTWDTCVTADKTYKFDPFGPGWKVINQ